MTKTFKKILIANRGEIARRIIKTCKIMGIQTVAIYSEADDSLPYVFEADESYCVGPPPSAESYLRTDKIIDVCKQAGVDAVHPGYGFLSENSEFAETLKKENITFIGPDAYAVEMMGDKIKSKNLAEKEGVPCIKGYNQDIKDGQEARKIAETIGYPLMLKAAAGGGGKGMRVVTDPKDIEMALDSARSESISSFKDDRVFMEKFVTNPRHIEIQVLFDKHGNGVYLNERECSIQRRNQKIIEEAPSPFVDAALRKKMGESALQLGHAVDYVGAGTVEFMMDDHHEFYFLEMNTRLQVEHPVTEFITGIDLVEQQIKIAAGYPLEFSQDEVKLDGWSFETRIYSEDPRNAFLPSTGTIFHYKEPEGENVRVDSGVTGGDAISLFYDPMIAKLITYGKNRDDALEKMIRSLKSYEIGGITPNIDFLLHILQHKEFKAGNLNTNFIAAHYPDGFEGVEFSETLRDQSIALMAWNFIIEREYQVSQIENREVVIRHKDELFTAQCSRNENFVTVLLNEKSYKIEYDGLLYASWKSLIIDGVEETIRFEKKGLETTITINGLKISAEAYSKKEASYLQWMPEKFDASSANEVYSPMPGKVVKIMVKTQKIGRLYL